MVPNGVDDGANSAVSGDDRAMKDPVLETMKLLEEMDPMKESGEMMEPKQELVKMIKPMEEDVEAVKEK